LGSRPFAPSRRDVLKGGAAASLAMGLGGFGDILKNALAAPTCGTLSDIEHVVIFIQENRSFDQYFGAYKGVRGFNDRSVRLHPGDDGTAVFRQSSAGTVVGTPNPLPPFRIDTSLSATRHEGDCTNDVVHQWADEHDMWHSGQMDRWVTHHTQQANGDKFAAITMGYYDGSPARDGSGEMDFYWALADNFTICDNYYCSVIGGTDANRLYSMTGTIDPDGFDGGLQFLDTSGSSTFKPSYDLGGGGRWLPYPQVLDAHRNAAGALNPITWKIYGFPDQLSPVTDNVMRYFPAYRNPTGSLFQRAFVPTWATDFIADCIAGTLPQVSWIITDSVDSEHPPASVLQGQDVTHILVSQLMGSKLWPKSAMILTYDENGGFFDHVPPPTPPPAPDPMAAGEYLDLAKLQANPTAKTEAGAFAAQPIGLGFRVPTLVISPFSRNPNPQGAPMVCSDTFDHTSLLKFLERVFGAEVPSRDARTLRPGLSAWRRDSRNIGDLTSAFNFAAAPNTGPINLPATSHADPRTVNECPSPAVTLGLGDLDPGYPTPAQVALPRQEAFAGTVRRPSGLCGVAVTTGSSPPAGPVPGTPNTAAGTGAALPASALLAGGLLAAGWWARRRGELEKP
jgi:phospholipase C